MQICLVRGVWCQCFVMDGWVNALYLLYSLTLHSVITFTLFFPIFLSSLSSPCPIYFLLQLPLSVFVHISLTCFVSIFFSIFLASCYFFLPLFPYFSKGRASRLSSESNITHLISYTTTPHTCSSPSPVLPPCKKVAYVR